MSNLAHAIAFAAAAHAEQKDRGGEPYVLHPLSVMRRVAAKGFDEAHRVVAVLHDAVEDTQTTLGTLKELGYSDEVVAAVDALTRRTAEPYGRYISRLAANPIAVFVKLADLEDNLDPQRIAAAERLEPGSTTHLVERYRQAFEALTGTPAPNLPITDTDRISALEQFVNENGALVLHDGNANVHGHCGLGLRPGNVNRSLRQAIDGSLLKGRKTS